MLKLNVIGDWSPPLQKVDVVEWVGRFPHGLLREAFEAFDVKVNHEWTDDVGFIHAAMRDGRLDAPLFVLNDKDDKLAMRLAAKADFSGRTVLCLVPGLGNCRTAKAFIRAGASAFIGIEGTTTLPKAGSWLFGTPGFGPGESSSRLMFIYRLAHELAWNTSTVRQAWERARLHGPGADAFKLYLAKSGRGGSPRRAIRVRPVERPPVWPARRGWKTIVSRATDWRPPAKAVDIIATTEAPCDDPLEYRMFLEHWGFVVRVHPCRNRRELVSLLRGRGLTAPFILILSHGSDDGTGHDGIRYARGVPGPMVLGPVVFERFIDLRAKVVIAEGCGLGNPRTAMAFMKGGLRAYIAPWRTGGCGLFVKQFFHEIGVRGATVYEAWKRSRLWNADTRRFRLYQRGAEIVDDTPAGPLAVRAPALLEGFERDTDNDWSGNWDYFRRPIPMAIPAPGRRPGLAHKLHFDFTREPWPELWIAMSWHGHRWLGATGLSFEAYVPRDLVLRKPLTCVCNVVGFEWEYSVEGIRLNRGWNKVKVSFASSGWRGRVPEKGEYHAEPFNLARVTPVKAVWLALDPRGRREQGAVHFDNLRLEGG